MTETYLVFDGDCGFCTWSVNIAQRWIRPNTNIVPWQRADLAALGLTAEQCQQAVQWVAETGDIQAGGRAVAALLQHSPAPWPVLGTFASVPGVAQLVDALYRLVAANRYRLPGSTPACRLPAAS
ncbi:DUF393 domain-containing protein [Candidatus Nanopelagicales bacterium]|nr:DUF393 domain-containing protein [Candidatus Nanopelagicales bacterium]